MFNSSSLMRTGRLPVLFLALGMALLSGCASKQQQALDQAKKQAAATGQPQQVVSVDKNGTTTTTVCAAAHAGTKERGGHHYGNAPGNRDARSGGVRPRSFRRAATASSPGSSTGQRKHPGRY